MGPLFLLWCAHHPVLHSFPTRRSSDLASRRTLRSNSPTCSSRPSRSGSASSDRKSTRLNSSHLGISYAVFCLKKKKGDVERHLQPVVDVWAERKPDLADDLSANIQEDA